MGETQCGGPRHSAQLYEEAGYTVTNLHDEENSADDEEADEEGKEEPSEEAFLMNVTKPDSVAGFWGYQVTLPIRSDAVRWNALAPDLGVPTDRCPAMRPVPVDQS